MHFLKQAAIIAATVAGPCMAPVTAATLGIELPKTIQPGDNVHQWMPKESRPMTPKIARACGVASFYGSHGDGFAWQTMANGRPMNPGAMIAAHPTLPLGTKIRVTNQSNGRSVRLTVTDRGPWSGGRILDLSSGAFGRIASHSQGLANVCYSRI